MPKQDQWGFFDEWVSIGFVLPKCCLSMTENVFDSCHKPGQVMSLGVFLNRSWRSARRGFFWRWMRGWFMWWLGWLQMVFHDRKVRLGYSQARPMQFCERESILLICVCYVGNHSARLQVWFMQGFGALVFGQGEWDANSRVRFEKDERASVWSVSFSWQEEGVSFLLQAKPRFWTEKKVENAKCKLNAVFGFVSFGSFYCFWRNAQVSFLCMSESPILLYWFGFVGYGAVIGSSWQGMFKSSIFCCLWQGCF